MPILNHPDAPPSVIHSMIRCALVLFPLLSLALLAQTALSELPEAISDYASGLPGQVITPISVLSNDVGSQGSTLTISAFTQPQKGTVADNEDGTLSYTPNVEFTSGKDSFTYTVSDGAEGQATGTVYVSVGLLHSGPWPMTGRDAAHTGYYPGTLNGQTFTAAWTVPLSTQALNQVSIAEGKVFIAHKTLNNLSQLSARDLTTGALTWSQTSATSYAFSGMAYHRGSLYLRQMGVTAGDRKMLSLTAETGETQWSSAIIGQTGDPMCPVVTDDGVYTATGIIPSRLAGYQRKTGDALFDLTVPDSFYRWTPAFYNGKAYTFLGGKLRQHHPMTGDIEWTVDLGWYVGTGSSLNRTVALADGAAFVVNNNTPNNELVCIDLATQVVRWKSQFPNMIGTPAVSGARVYCFNSNGFVYAYNVTTGAQEKVYTSTGISSSGLYQPIVTDDVLIVTSASSTAILDLTTGTRLQLISSAGGQSSLSNGSLLLAGADGTLRCFRPTGSNTPAQAQAQTATCVEEQNVTITLTGTDANNDALQFLITELPTKGSLYQTPDGVQLGSQITELPVLTQHPEGMVIYQPEQDGFGTAYTTFKFRVSDGFINSAEAIVTVDVTNVNDAPHAVDDIAYLRPGQELPNYRPTGNDEDVDGDVLEIVSFTQPEKGTLTQNPDGSLRYVPAEAFVEGTDTFQYTLEDAGGVTATGSVEIRISATYGQQWTQEGNGPDHTGAYPGTLGTGPWVEKWYYSGGQLRYDPAHVAVAGDLIFFSQNSNGDDPPYRLKALSRRTGALVWQQTFTAAISHPVWHEGLVYICKYQDGVDQLIAFQGSDGRESWHSTITGPHDFGATTPAISSLGAFMLHSRESGLSSLWGFDLDTQTSRFSTDLPEFLNTASPSIHDGHVYSYLGENLRQHSPQTGEVLWTLPLPGGQYNSPTRNVCLQGNKAWLTAADADSSQLVCVNLSPPSLSWVKPGVYYGNPVISNGIVYVASSQKVSAFFSGTGAWLADYPTPDYTVSSLMVSHDQLIVFCYGKVFFFSLQDQQLLSTLPFGSSNEVSGAAVEGELILAEEDIAGFIRLFVHADPTNQPPIAQAQTVETMEDEEVTLQLTGTDGDMDTLSYAVRTLPVKGTLYQTADGVIKGAAITTLPAHVWDPQGRLIYVPVPDSFGQGIGSFTFTAHDDVSASSAATVTFTISPKNDPPTAIPDIIALLPGRSLQSFHPEANDRDPDGDVLTVTAFTQGSSGLVSQNPDGSLNYMPNAGFLTGSDNFSYTIQDNNQIQSTATVTVTLSSTLGRTWPTYGGGPEHTGFVPVSLGNAPLTKLWRIDFPSAADQVTIADNKVFVSMNGADGLTALDQPTGSIIWSKTLEGISGSSEASMFVSQGTWFNGKLYVKQSNYTGGRMNLLNGSTGELLWATPYNTNRGDNKAPIADADSVYAYDSGAYGGSLFGFNASAGTALFSTAVPAPTDTPTLHDGGLYSFSTGKLKSHDKTTGSSLWTLDLEGTGHRTIACVDGRAYLVNDLPLTPDEDFELICVDLSTHTPVWRVRGTFSGTPAVAHQSVFVRSGNRSIHHYDAATGAFLGEFTCSKDIRLDQPIVTHDTLIVPLSNQTDLFNLSDHSLRQSIPNEGEISLAGETLYIASSTLSAYGVPNAQNAPPAALTETLTTPEDTPLTVTLQATDAESDPLSFIITSLPTEGALYQTVDGVTLGAPITQVPALVSNVNATVIYLPPANVNGTAVTNFQFAAGDGFSVSSAAKITLNVQAVNDAPTAQDDFYQAEAGQVLSPLRQWVNDYDIEGDEITFTSFTLPQLGSLVQHEDGGLAYQAPANITEGTDHFTYTIRDPSGLLSTATVTITIAPAEEPSWATNGKEPNHKGYSANNLGRGGFARLWSHTVVNPGNSIRPIASGDGRVFATFQDDSHSRVVALDIHTGNELWSRSFATAHSMSPPSYHAGRIYVARSNYASDSQLIAFQANTGNTAWTAPFEADEEYYHLAPAVSDLGVFINGGTQGGMYGFALNDGADLFYQPKSDQHIWTPAITGSELYAFTGGEFTRHDPVSGAAIWSLNLEWQAGSAMPPRIVTLENRYAFLINNPRPINSPSSDLVCLDLDTREVLWSVPGSFATHSAADNNVYVVAPHSVQVRSARHGVLLGTYTLPNNVSIYGRPVITRDLVIITSYNNTYLFDRYSRELLQTLDIGGEAAVVGSTLLISSPLTNTVSAWASPAAPLITPAGGTFDQPVAVTVGKVEPDTHIYYTLDGSAPNLDSRSFVSGSTVTLDASAQLRVISVKGSDVSSIQQATFTLPDSDNDGLPDWWEMQHFGLVTAASEETDNDLDGMSDLEEFLTGTDPRSAADSFIGRVMSDDGTVTLTWPSKAGRIYTIETSPDLVHWTPATAEIRGTGSPLQHTLNSGGESRAFSRIRAQRDLAVP